MQQTRGDVEEEVEEEEGLPGADESGGGGEKSVAFKRNSTWFETGVVQSINYDAQTCVCVMNVDQTVEYDLPLKDDHGRVVKAVGGVYIVEFEQPA